jgi:hypothetical protein
MGERSSWQGELLFFVNLPFDIFFIIIDLKSTSQRLTIQNVHKLLFF